MSLVVEKVKISLSLLLSLSLYVNEIVLNFLCVNGLRVDSEVEV